MQKRLAAWLAAATLIAPLAATAQDASPEVQAVDALNKVFGKHPGMRANHAKGVVLEGSFAASPDAASLTTAAHLQPGVTVPIIARFSDATGLPDIPDNVDGANPHGLAVRFHLPDGSDTDIVINSLHFFPVRTVSDFRDLLLAVAASPAGSPKPTKLDAFLAAHPAAGPAFGSAVTPASLATEDYFGIDAFVFTNKAGQKQAFRYEVVPAEGSAVHLSAADAAKQGPNFLMDDIVQRVKRGPVRFRLLAQLAAPGDPTKDATIPWPADRKLVDLGTITLSKAVPDSKAAEKPLLFLPGQLTAGIDPSDDPLIDSRDTAYAESFARRSQ
jgi:catalase